MQKRLTLSLSNTQLNISDVSLKEEKDSAVKN